MQPGDIVFSVAQVDDGTSTKIPRVLIRAGQWVKAKVFENPTPNVPVVHAAIAVNEYQVIESVNGGIVVSDLRQEPSPRSAMVFTCTNRRQAGAAAYVAEQFQRDVATASIEGAYSKLKAAFSLFSRANYEHTLQARIDESVDIGSDSFCSQFVANAYEVGNLYCSANIEPPPPSVFSIRPSYMTPYELASFCDNSAAFYFAGFWQNAEEYRL